MRRTAIALFTLVTLAGCVDEFHGSNVQIDLASAAPVQASEFRAAGPGELPSDIHFTLYALSETTDASGAVVGQLFELQRFELHRVVDLASPCYIDVGEHVPFPGLHVSQYAAKIKQVNGIDDVANPPPSATEAQKIDVATAIQRQANIDLLSSDSGPKVISSASSGRYPALGVDCNDPAGIPPPTCTDEASNQRRLERCEAAWAGDGAFYEGTDRVLTDPLDGLAYGFVTGLNPINFAPVGGAAFFVDEALVGFDGFAIYWQYDAAPSADLGEMFLFGRPEQPTRGVIHVRMTSVVSPALSADLAIFANIDEDDVHF